MTVSVMSVLLLQLWRCIMASVEWNKKEELVAEQALKYLKVGGRREGRWCSHVLCVLYYV